MPKTCIICGKRAGSREHVFPASLGGRRTNKGIYCGPHNNGFSPLADIVKRQLESINALLAVRPDHKDRAEPMAYISPEGEQLIIFDGVVRRATPDPSGADASHHVQLRLGGPEGLRAIAYIALTFFAHHFQAHARHEGLDGVKAYALDGGDNCFVWWERPNKLALLSANPFPFGHSIVVMTSASQEATAFVSLFQSLHFGVRLGTLSELTDKSVIVFIDPQAESPPRDIEEHRHDAVLIPLVRPQPMHAYLERNVRERVNESALQELLAKIERWTFEKEMTSVLVRFNGLRGLPVEHQKSEVTAIAEYQVGRVYWLMRHIVRDFANARADNPIARPVVQHIESLIARDTADPAKLTPTAEDCAIRCTLALMRELGSRLAERDLTMEDLWDVFHSGRGAGIVGDIMFAPFR